MFGGWLPARGLCGVWLGLVNEPASLISHDKSYMIIICQSEFWNPVAWQQMCRPPGGNKSFSGGPPGMEGPPGG